MAESWATSAGLKSRRVSVWTLRTPTTWSRQVSGHGEHRGDEAPLVQAADPEEPRVLRDVRDHDRLPRRRHAPGDPLPERDDGAADVVAVEAGGGGQRQLEAAAIEEVERRDAGVERVPRAVHHGLEELLPRAGRRGEPEDLVEEPELGDRIMARGGAAAAASGSERVRGAARAIEGPGSPSSVDIGITPQA